MLLNCLPEGAWQPLPLPSLLPKQVQPLAVEIGSSDNDIEGSDLMEVEEEAEEVEAGEGSVTEEVVVEVVDREVEEVVEAVAEDEEECNL